ncbi:5-formyltetrahydrofolate cyclo-ligase [Aestuariimicrobium ganziense]|uniref:5-formyltetrahydrofolate cyclo-ligase n=1 Tax=Aestuariimicrobium ganziense TaxID=2773677 RepID=UPI0019427498|nr:5-formyltetrahydrofolate cyclo-ligase [Aestuariimicrobium ganziense]
MPHGDDAALAAAKKVLRDQVRRERSALDPVARRARDAARTGWLLESAAGFRAVAAYASIGDEPGTLDLLARLADRGQQVLLPVLTPLAEGVPRREPAWAWMDRVDDLRPGLWGIGEPAGDALPAEALAGVDLVLSSGLAAGRDGSRLGAGGGWYDRALPHRRPGVPVWTLADHLADTVPHGPLDQRVDAVATADGLVRVGL